MSSSIPKSSTNLKNRVNKLYLPKTKALLPLFEVISNSIHAIQEKAEKLNTPFNGKVVINTIRNGDVETLRELPDINGYPIHSFEIIDNGIGLDEDNFNSFLEFDTEKKAKIGGKGIGRLVCLKAFDKLVVDSVYFEKKELVTRRFEYKKTANGFEKYEGNTKSNEKTTGTRIRLSKYENEYEKNIPFNIIEIAREIINHFQLYFIQKKEPKIIIRNQNNYEIDLRTLFDVEFAGEILSDSFYISDQEFKVFISRSYKAKSHKIHYCAHERSVKEEGVSKYLEDLKLPIKEDLNGDSYYFQIFVIGNYLDTNVNDERTGFNFVTDEDIEEIDLFEISLSKIRKETIKTIENLLGDFLKKARQEKMNSYYPVIESEFPNYHSVITHNREEVEKIPAGLNKNELDLKLYEIESRWRLRVKSEGKKLLEQKKDITTLDEYKTLYENFLNEFNEIGQSDLARYVVHRRAVIDLLDNLIELNQEEKFANEDIIHSLFFPIRETGKTAEYDKQNLWLIDERLTFNSLLASDKMFNQINDLSSSSRDRIDLLVKKEEVFEDATIFAEEKNPFESFTIIEFKRPERNDYIQGDRSKDPIKQVRAYIEEIIKDKEKLRGKCKLPLFSSHLKV